MNKGILPLVRRIMISTSAAGIGVILLFLLFSPDAQSKEEVSIIVGPVYMPQAITPTVLTVSPDEMPNNLDMVVNITGTDFKATLTGTLVLTSPTVNLDNFTLPAVDWINSTTLTATVLWGMDPGTYTITVVNPDGGIGSLPNALTVTQAIGVWTTGGPYGGGILDLAVSPVTSQTAYAAASSGGLFRTRDDGQHWSLVGGGFETHGIVYGTAPTYTVYCWGWGGTGLQRSDDDGETWHQISRDGISFALDPQDEQRMWIATADGNVQFSNDGGAHWEIRSNGVPTDTFVKLLAVDPISSSIVYAGMSDGWVFKTTDEGLHWDLASNGLPTPNSNNEAYALVVNPSAPNVVLFSRMHDNVASAYRSSDGGETWSPIIVGPEKDGFISDLAFSPQVSGTVYASLFGDPPVAVSHNGGLTWTTVSTQTHIAGHSIGLDPTSGLPVYIGGWTDGTRRSDDGGRTWRLATDGITALLIKDMAASSAQPASVYVAADDAGPYVSDNAGRSWRLLDLPDPYASAVAVDPQQPNIVYLGAGGGVFRSQANGTNWGMVGMPVTYNVGIIALVVAPVSPSVVYAGGCDGDAFQLGQKVGVSFRSIDYGANWAELDIGQPISIVTDIAIDPTDSRVVYLATGWRAKRTDDAPGLGVFRTRDGGDTWQSVTQGMGYGQILALAIRPDRPQTIYASSFLKSNEKATVFKSTDGGDLWMTTSLQLDWGAVTDLAIDPLAPETVYAGTNEGLFKSSDDGTTWTRAAGKLGHANVEALVAVSTDERTILYVGTLGGFPSGASTDSFDVAAMADDDFIQGGVYQQTIVHRLLSENIYLPLVLRE